MIFAAFGRPEGAARAFTRLESAGFEKAGFSVIGANTERSEPASRYPDHPALDELVRHMNLAPTLTVEGRDVASSGALPKLLNPSPNATFHGLRNAFENAGAPPSTAAAFADAVRDAGLVVGAASEGPGRAEEARSIFEAAGARETAALEVPDDEDRP
jgi:hypothetical protein